MIHYTYLLMDPDSDKMYIGVRSYKGNPVNEVVVQYLLGAGGVPIHQTQTASGGESPIRQYHQT